MSDPTQAAPAASPATPESNTAAPSAVNWDEINPVVPMTDDPEDPAAIPAAPVAPAPAPAPVVAADPAAPAPAATPVAPAVAPVVPPVVAPPVQPVQPVPQPGPTPEQLAEQQKQFTTKLEEEVAKMFAADMNSEEVKRQLTVAPEEALPKILARVTTTAMQMAVHMMQQQLPRQVQQHTAQATASAKAAEAFFSEHKDLLPHGEMVSNAARVVSQMPDFAALTPQQRGTRIAAIARTFIGLPAVAGAPAAPAAPPARPFTPAPAGSGTVASPAAAPVKAGAVDWGALATDTD